MNAPVYKYALFMGFLFLTTGYARADHDVIWKKNDDFYDASAVDALRLSTVLT